MTFLLRAQIVDLREERFDLLVRDRRSRLIHDQHVGAVIDGPEDLQRLDLGDGERAEPSVDGEVQPLFGKNPARLATDELPVDLAEFHRQPAHEEALSDRHARHVVELLRDHRDPMGTRFDRVLDPNLFTAHTDRPAVGLVDAVDDLHQGGLACAVLTAQRMHCAGAHFERNIVECLHSGERLRDSLNRQQRFRHDLPRRLGSSTRRTRGMTIRFSESVEPSPVSDCSTCSMPYSCVTSESSSTCPDSSSARAMGHVPV